MLSAAEKDFKDVLGAAVEGTCVAYVGVEEASRASSCTALGNNSTSSNNPHLLQAEMLSAAEKDFKACIEKAASWEDFMAALERGHMVIAPWCAMFLRSLTSQSCPRLAACERIPITASMNQLRPGTAIILNQIVPPTDSIRQLLQWHASPQPLMHRNRALKMCLSHCRHDCIRSPAQYRHDTPSF